MGFFDSKWIIEFEYSDGFFASYKKERMLITAFSEYGAKAEAKKLLESHFKHVRILSVRQSKSRDDEKTITFFIKREDKPEPIKNDTAERIEKAAEEERKRKQRLQSTLETKLLQEELDIKSGFVASYCNYEPDVKKVKIPLKHHKLTAIAPALKSVETIVLHENVDEIQLSSVHCLKEFVVDPNNQWFASIDGVLYDKKAETLLYVPASLDIQSLNIPNTCVIFRNGAFRDVRVPNEFVIPSQLKRIGDLRVKYRFLIEEGNTEFAVEDGILYSKDKTKVIARPIKR